LGSLPIGVGHAALDGVIRSRLADGYRTTFTIRRNGRAVGITSVLFDPDDPAAAIRKLGATELGIRSEHLVRRDGSRRRSRIFRLDGPGRPTSEPT
jgi:hypothetical protein